MTGDGPLGGLNTLSVVFTVLAGGCLIALPQRWAVIALLLGVAYVPRDAAVELGPATFTVLRILVAVGVLRALVRGERFAKGLNDIDRLMLLWALWLLGSSVFHSSDTWLYRTGIIWTELGSYTLFRVFVRDWDDVLRVFKVCCAVLVPVAVLMLVEKASGENLFAAFGGVSDVGLREGHVRARGPFAHPILAGTVGATCLPMALYLWTRHRVYAMMGTCAAIGIVFASTSSGPIMMSVVIIGGLLLWNVRHSLRAIRWLALLAVVLLDLVMRDPVYFLVARIDITGGSKGWHRAQLIRSSLEHLEEWWLVGTDYTRHWMATGQVNEAHTDITNHLLAAGVTGGVPLMLLLTLMLIAGFRGVGRGLRQSEGASPEQGFLIWTLGAILFGHAVNLFGISLFDQSIVFFYLVLASIGAVRTSMSRPGNVMTLQARERMS